MGLTEQQCMVNADDPEYIFSTSYETDDANPPGVGGSTREHIEPFCGRWVLRRAWREGWRDWGSGRRKYGGRG